MPSTLDDSPSELNALFQNHTDAIISYEFEGADPIIRAVNQTFEHQFGYEEADVVGRPIDDVIVPEEDEVQQTAEDLNEAARRGEPVDVSVRRRTTTGDRYFRLRKVPVDPDGRSGFALYTDITERREYQRQLRAFRRAIENTGHGVMLTDTNGVIEYVNPAFETLTGYDRQEVVGRTPGILKSGVHDDAFYDDLWQTITSGERWEGEIVNHRKDGSRYHIQQTIAPIFDPSGETVERFVAVNQDITDHVEHERELRRQNERLEEYGQTVAHDLRNPLTVIEGRIELAKHSENPDTHLDHALENAERMRALIEDLLTLAKQGTRVMDPEPETLETLASAAWSQVETTDASLTIADSARFEVDEGRTRELLENLFRNAVEHAGDDVALEVGVTPSGTGFYVADDGPGIPPSDRDRVFGSGYTTSEEGTGFGLAIVKSIADAHGWAIDVTGHHTGGARFEVTGVERAT